MSAPDTMTQQWDGFFLKTPWVFLSTLTHTDTARLTRLTKLIQAAWMLLGAHVALCILTLATRKTHVRPFRRLWMLPKTSSLRVKRRKTNTTHVASTAE